MNTNRTNHLLNEVVVREIQFFIPIELNIILLCTCKKALQNINIQRENVNLFSYDLSKIKNKCNCNLSIIYNMQFVKKKSHIHNSNSISFNKVHQCRFIQLNEKLSINRFNSLKIVLPNDNYSWMFEEMGELKLKCRYEKHNENCSIKLKKKFFIRYRLSHEYITNQQDTDNIPIYICEDCLLANALENIHL